ncbi:hypothetical protein ETB97_002105 [Aspergillus alliaceus]|uniref:Lytic polysaccharide monooxygenase n=1 Tax=Petromyces alliaceus TaxID=209559 RepID=A0A5N7C640_PETAA|nr:hypothetical protein BDV23DRAFT_184336 [Aspergillus alliaceus]KAF5860019.1 hypothetical protein ETB97_002105 [Aspergillus burnettii]
MLCTALMAAALLGTVVNSHMILKQPPPYGKDTLDNSPLAADGSNFPCKLRPGAFQAPAGETVARIGESMPLSFIGSATHGGGSCQVSLTSDLQPSKDSKWMVIKSIEGGCPANVAGNLDGGADLEGATVFHYTIPEGIDPGQYTLAWTWFNRIGNREMYMNCAPITVAVGSSERSANPEENVVLKRSASFPPMFIANINGCITKEGIDIRFPDPGDDVEFAGNPANLAPVGSAVCTGVPTFGGDGMAAGTARNAYLEYEEQIPNYE